MLQMNPHGDLSFVTHTQTYTQNKTFFHDIKKKLGLEKSKYLALI